MSKIINNVFAKAIFCYMSKGLDKLVRLDSDVKKRLEIVPCGSIIKLEIMGEKASLTLKKCEDGFAFVKDKEDLQADLTITLKFFQTLPKIVFGTSSVTECYLNDEFFVQGNLRWALAIVFALEKFMAYIMSKKKFQNVYGVEANNTISKGKMLRFLLFAKRRIN